jgi:8-oxo-dGTP pyrophosphatase MutT (NUDIX family)
MPYILLSLSLLVLCPLRSLSFCDPSLCLLKQGVWPKKERSFLRRMTTIPSVASYSAGDSLLNTPPAFSRPLQSLIDSFILLIHEPLQQSSYIEMMCELVSIQNSQTLGEGCAAAISSALSDTKDYTFDTSDEESSGRIRITGRWVPDIQDERTAHVHIHLPTNNILIDSKSESDLNRLQTVLDIVSRVILQRLFQTSVSFSQNIQSVFFHTSTDRDMTTTDDNHSQVYTFAQLTQEGGFPQLFSSLLDLNPTNIHSIEMSNMVDITGKVMAYIPRPLVHKLNILHNGVGILVWRPTNTSSENTHYIDIYVHKRTSTKRIFPCLYDMFVGGVCTNNEPVEITAARELEEELNLRHSQECLSQPLFTCIICTSYNRCVVTVFTYSYLSQKDTIQWQLEEVEWGDFVPYSVVQQEAALSMERMKTLRSWPGRVLGICPIIKDRVSFTFPTTTLWDFVPDGLLVWEFWLDYVYPYRTISS